MFLNVSGTLLAPINRIFSQCVQHTLQSSARDWCSAPLSALTPATLVKYWEPFAKNPFRRCPTCLLLCRLGSLVQLFAISSACSAFPGTGLVRGTFAHPTCRVYTVCKMSHKEPSSLNSQGTLSMCIIVSKHTIKA